METVQIDSMASDFAAQTIKANSELMRSAWGLGVKAGMLPNTLISSAKFGNLVQSIERFHFTLAQGMLGKAEPQAH